MVVVIVVAAEEALEMPSTLQSNRHFLLVCCHEVRHVPYVGTKSTPCRVVGYL